MDPFSIFPYEPRPMQGELVASLHRLFLAGGRAIVEAGTGFGKTVAALVPAVSAARELGKRVVYATRTLSQQRQVMVELRRIAEREEVFGVALQGRSHLCPYVFEDRELRNGTPEELSRFCSRMRKEGDEYYNNLLLHRGEALDFLRTLPMPEEVLAWGMERRICPYELLREALGEALVVAVPYNYFLSPSIRPRLLDSMGVSEEDVILIVDEAHNLPDFGRELRSARLTTWTLRAASSEAERNGVVLLRGIPAADLASALEVVMHSLMEELVEEEDAVVPPGEVESRLGRLLGVNRTELAYMAVQLYEAGEAIAAQRLKEGKLPRSYLRYLGAFLEHWMGAREEDLIHIVGVEGGRPYLEVYALDPARGLLVLRETHATLLMSGTLRPLDVFAEETGLPDAETLSLPSPFPRRNRLVIYDPSVTTRYEVLRRDPRMAEEIAHRVRRILDEVDRNAAVFFPSYDLLNRIWPMVGIPGAYVDDGSLGQAELMRMFSDFLEGGGVLVSVAGGRLAEGMDYPGTKLELVILVGIPYPKPTAKARAIERYYSDRGKNGWRHAFEAPAARRMLQAIGRLIRSERDRGVAVILDRRAARFRRYIGEMLRSTRPWEAARAFF